MRSIVPGWFDAGLIVMLAVALTPPEVGAQNADGDCTACHAELEYLRQQAPDMATARRLLVSHGDIAASAHAEQSCADCHGGFTTWPHPDRAVTESCASCHEPQEDDWHLGIHSEPGDDGLPVADCVDCHTLHTVADSASIVDGPEMTALNSRCVSCHETFALPEWDAHSDTISCASCHAAHEMRIADASTAWVAPSIQLQTCGSCHEEAAEKVRTDAHGSALLESPPRGLAEAKLLGADAPASCTSCHGAHGIHMVEDPEAPLAILNQCSACHADESDRYFGTYHGKATALGSVIVATCADCHESHGIFPSDSAASTLHESNVVETCADCHENSNASFVGYDSHPDPLDMERNPPLFFSFVFMNGLLLSVLVVFGLHTALWWIRILIDHRRGREGAEHV